MRRAFAMSSISALALLAVGGRAVPAAARTTPRSRRGRPRRVRRRRRRRPRGWRRRRFGRRRRMINCGDPYAADRSDGGHRRHGDARLHDGPRGGRAGAWWAGGDPTSPGAAHHAERRRRRRDDPGRPLRQQVRDARDRPGLHRVGGAERVDGLGLRRRRRRGTAAQRRRLPHRRHVLGAHRRHVVEQGPPRASATSTRVPRAASASTAASMDVACYDTLGVDLTQLDTTWRQYRIPFGGLTQRNFGLPRHRARHAAASTRSSSASTRSTPFDFWLDDISFY